MLCGYLTLCTLLAAASALATNAQVTQAKHTTQSAGEYRVVQKIPIPGDGGYDYVYVDEATHRLYVAHGTEVAVLDTHAGAMIGMIAGLAGVHGISVVPGIGKPRSSTVPGTFTVLVVGK